MCESGTYDSTNIELDRIHKTYKMRDKKMPFNDWKANIYHPRHPLGQLFHEHNHSLFVKMINNLGINLEHLRILDVGCGYGYWLRYIVELGAQSINLTGVDLSEDRINFAKQMNSSINWLHNEEKKLPFPSESFDITMQVVVFSSILDENLRTFLAGEMLRVTKIGGYIFWIDHKTKKSNELAGFSKSKVCEYFPNCSIINIQSMHPRYFRLLYKRHALLSQIIYHFTKYWCDSWFLVLKKDGDFHERI